mgnify:CR=1 FL=1
MDGPEFDGHQVDFDEMLKRMGAFKEIERQEMQPILDAFKLASVVQNKNKAEYAKIVLEILNNKDNEQQEDFYLG